MIQPRVAAIIMCVPNCGDLQFLHNMQHSESTKYLFVKRSEYFSNNRRVVKGVSIFPKIEELPSVLHNVLQSESPSVTSCARTHDMLHSESPSVTSCATPHDMLHSESPKAV